MIQEFVTLPAAYQKREPNQPTPPAKGSSRCGVDTGSILSPSNGIICQSADRLSEQRFELAWPPGKGIQPLGC